MALFDIDLTGDKEIRDKLKTLGKKGIAIVAKVLRKDLRDAVTYGRDKHLSGRSATTLGNVSGDLRNAFWYEVKPSAGEVTARLGFIRGRSGRGGRQTSALRYAFTHEFGAGDGGGRPPIRPKRGKFLRVPAPFALTGAGRMKAAYNVEDARSIPNTRVIRSASGTLAIWQFLGKVGHPIFWLVKQVVIPKRPTLQPTWKVFRPIIFKDIKDEFRKEL